MKKIILTTLMGISLIGFSLTNKEIIEQGGVRQKQTFDKYFNGNSGNTRRDPNLLNRVYPEIVLGLYNRNKQTFDNEITRLGKMKDGRKNILRPLLPSFNEYINENSVFTKNFLKNFLEEKDDFQSYIYTATSISLENFYLNMNTLLEAEKNESSLEENVDTVMDYLYHSGDEKTKEDYIKMSNSELDRLVSNEFAKLNAEIDKKINEELKNSPEKILKDRKDTLKPLSMNVFGADKVLGDNSYLFGFDKNGKIMSGQELETQVSQQPSENQPAAGAGNKVNPPTKEVIAYLAQKFPLCFSLEGEAKPLKVGLFQDLAEALADDETVSKTQLRQVLRTYTMSWRYLACCQENAVRVGLQGEEAGVVDAQQAEHAAQSLAQAKEAFNARKAEQRKAQRKESFKKKSGEQTQAKKRPFNKAKKPQNAQNNGKASAESLAALATKFGR